PEVTLCLRLDLSDQAELDELGADFAENRTLHRVGRRQATVLALRCGAHHHKLRIGKFDAHDPTLPLIQEAPTIWAPHQDEPRIGQSRWGGWVTRARRAASANDTNASFRTESQSFVSKAELERSRQILIPPYGGSNPPTPATHS